MALSPHDTVALELMREEFLELKEDGNGLALDDSTFLRYLRARKFDVERAKAMLHETLKWRRNFDLENLSTTWQSTISKENSTGKVCVLSTFPDLVVSFLMKWNN